MKKLINTAFTAAVALGLSAVNGMAANAIPGAVTGTAMPWEQPMGNIAGSLSGNTALYVTDIGVVLAGGAMLWHGDLGEFGNRVAKVAVAGGTMLFSYPFIKSAFNVSAALI